MLRVDLTIPTGLRPEVDPIATAACSFPGLTLDRNPKERDHRICTHYAIVLILAGAAWFVGFAIANWRSPSRLEPYLQIDSTPCWLLAGNSLR